jgi:Ser/Thr protein kinase RdoA (MazF antagonist)
VLSDETAAKLSQVYDIGEWLSWVRTPRGASNESFFLTTSRGHYVLRRSNALRTVEGLAFERDLINHLRSFDYPAPEIVPTGDGGSFHECDGSLYTLTVRIQGGPYRADNPAHLTAAAGALASYHVLAAGYAAGGYKDGSLPVEQIHDTAAEALDGIERAALEHFTPQYRDELIAALPELSRHLDEVDRELRELPYSALPRLVIHASFGRSALIYAGDELVGVVDYDRAYEEARLFDLAYSVKALSRTLDAGTPDYRMGLDLPRVRRFMDAYQRHAPLNGLEIEAFPLIFRVQRLRKISTKCQNYLRKYGSIGQVEKDQLKLVRTLEREVVRLGWLEQHQNDLRDAITLVTTRGG